MDEPFLCKMLQTMCDDEVWQNWLVSCLHDDKKLVILIKNASVFFLFYFIFKGSVHTTSSLFEDQQTYNVSYS